MNTDCKDEIKSRRNDKKSKSYSTSGEIGIGALILLFPQGLTLFASYFIQIFLAWYFPPSQYGAFFVVVSLSMVLSFLLNTGIPQAVSKLSSEDRANAKSAVLTGLRSGLIIAVGISIAVYFASDQLAFWLGDLSLTSAIRVSVLILIPNSIHGIVVGYFNGLKKFTKQGLILSSQLIFRMILVYMLVTIGGTIVFALMGYVGASIIAGILAIVMLGVNRENSEDIGIRRIMNLAFPITIMYFIFNLVLNLDVFWLKASPVVNSDVVGYYSGAAMIARAPYFLITAISGSTFPAISELHGRHDRIGIQKTISDWFERILIILLPILIPIALLSEEIIGLILPSFYTAASMALSILVFGMGAFSLFTWMAIILIATGHYDYGVAIVFVVLGIDAYLNWLLIPCLGIHGAATAILIASCIGFLIPALLLRREYGSYHNNASFLRTIGVCLLLASLTLLLKILNLPLIFLGLIITLSYLIILNFSGLLNLMGLKSLKQIILKRKDDT